MRKVVLLFCFLLMMISCNQITETEQDVVQVKTGWEQDPEMKRYLAGGYNTVTKESIGIAIKWEDFNGANEPFYDDFNLDYKEVKNTEELANFVNESYSASASGWGVSAQFSNKISKDINFNSSTITYIVKCDKKLKQALIEGESLRPELVEYFKNDPIGFRRMYGDSYVYKALLGERFVMVLSVSVDDHNATTVQKVKGKLSANISGFISGSAKINLIDSVTSVTSNLSIVNKIHTTKGEYTPALTGDQFLARFEQFKNMINNGDGDLTPLRQYYKPYSYLVNGTIENYNQRFMFRKWSDLLAEVTYMKNSVSNSKFIRDCSTALNKIANNMVLCSNLSPSARYPRNNEFSELEKDAIRLSSEITERSTFTNNKLRVLRLEMPKKLYSDWKLKYKVYGFKGIFGYGYGYSKIKSDGESAQVSVFGDAFLKKIKIWLDGAPNYVDVLYRVKDKKGVWTSWYKNGSYATVPTTLSKDYITDIEVKIVVSDHTTNP